MSMISFANGRIVTSAGILPEAAFALDDDRIEKISSISSGDRVIDLQGGWLLPGFIDTQVNGGGGKLFNDDLSVEAIETIASAHRRYGTTALLPTLISDDLSTVVAALNVIDAAIEAGVPGIVGIHLEGPFLNPVRKGVHEERHFRRLDPQIVDILSKPRRGVVLLTIAPELADPMDIVTLVGAGVRVSAGHTDATFEQMAVAIEAGLDAVTHLFNAMSPLRHRELGVTGAALDAGLYCGLIADGAHVHPGALRIAVRALPRDRVMLVTDAMPSVGSLNKDFVLQGKAIRVRNGICTGPDGGLAGSDLDMALAVRNIVEMTGISVEDASAMASRNPATFLGLSATRGSLAPGQRADWVLLDQRLSPVETWIGGRPATDAERSAAQGIGTGADFTWAT